MKLVLIDGCHDSKTIKTGLLYPLLGELISLTDLGALDAGDVRII